MIPYITVAKEAEATTIEKKSKFIASVKPVDSQEAAEAFLAQVRKQHVSASHNVPAYILGLQGEVQKCSDDGEPSGSAGAPVLEVLKAHELVNVCVVVTRYFGGTLLGRGGLVRAYCSAAKAGITQSGLVKMVPAVQVRLQVDYHLSGKVENELRNMEIQICKAEYTADVTFLLSILCAEQSLVKDRIQEITANQFRWEVLTEVYHHENFEE